MEICLIAFARSRTRADEAFDEPFCSNKLANMDLSSLPSLIGNLVLLGFVLVLFLVVASGINRGKDHD